MTDINKIKHKNSEEKPLNKRLTKALSFNALVNPHVERIKNNKEKLYERLLAHKKNPTESIGEGSQAEVFFIPMSINKIKENILVIKKKKNDTLGYSPKKEFELHLQAHSVLEDHNIKNIKIPTPYMYIHIDDEEYILMEYLEGKSIFFLQAQKVCDFLLKQDFIKKYCIKHGISIDLSTYKTDKEMWSVIDLIVDITLKSGDAYGKKIMMPFIVRGMPKQKREYRNKIKSCYDNLLKDGHRVYIMEKKSSDIKSDLFSAIELLHDNDIHHNDLNPTNIFYNKNNETLGIIDFGLSDIKSGNNEDLKTLRTYTFGNIINPN